MMIFFSLLSSHVCPCFINMGRGCQEDGAEAERTPALPLGSSQPTWKEVLLHVSSLQRHTQTGRRRPFELFSFFKKNLFIFWLHWVFITHSSFF